jgi:hypothetical protein
VILISLRKMIKTFHGAIYIFHFWTGTDIKNSNNTIMNYQACVPLTVGAQYHTFKLTITNHATTR